MRLRVDMSADLSPMEAKLRLDSADMHRVALAGLRGMTKYVPMDTGELMGSGHVEGEEAVWSTDYAVYAYFPRGHIHTTKNPTAHRSGSASTRARARQRWCGRWFALSTPSEGVSAALYEWAKGYGLEGLTLNGLTTEAGERSLMTSAATTTREYISGAKERTVYFSLLLVEPWSELDDGLNPTAMQEGERWLDWVNAQMPSNAPDLGTREVVELQTDDDAPVLVQVLPDAMVAKYQFQAHLTYRS